MLKNEKQYKMAKVKLDKWLQTQDQLQKGASAGQPDWIVAEQAFGIEQQIKQLLDEISEYELTESGQRPLPDPTSVLDIPVLLIRWRIACHLTQKDLAAKLGLHENQIQKYESENYGCASFDTISRVANMLGQVAQEQKAARANEQPF
jgi:HTH-type transcriptional regulator/antitoxin HigA